MRLRRARWWSGHLYVKAQMRMPLRILLIALVAPTLTHLAAAVVLVAPLLVFTAPVSYPISVLVTGAALSVLNKVFSRGAKEPAQQLGIVLAVGAVLGLMAYLLLSWALSLSALMAAWYSAFGLVNGVVCWALYNWGPLRERHRVSLK